MSNPSPLPTSTPGVEAAAAGLDAGASERLRGAVALLALGAAAGGAAVPSYDALKQRLRSAMVRDPLDALAALVLGCSYLFYLAEQGQNPRCSSFLDALVFLSTRLSGGHDEGFARTDAGKAIASFVMTFGPALSMSALRPPASAPDEALDQGRAILDRLDAILDALRAPR